MIIGPNTVVLFHYTLRNEDGEELESSRGGEPTLYLHGANNIVVGLEEQLTGYATGDVFTAQVEPARAYGKRDPERRQRVPVKHLLYKGKLNTGDVVQLNTREGRVPVTVIKPGKFSVDIDTNHPLAGRTLSFDIEIIDVREATEEERTSRRAQAPGGEPQ